MERNLILNEFLNLRKLLNQGNELANEVTQFRFEIELTSESEYRLLAVVFGHQDRNMIELARRDPFGNWDRSGFTKFKRLENFCAEFLNKSDREDHNRKKNLCPDSVHSKIARELLNKFEDLLTDYLP